MLIGAHVSVAGGLHLAFTRAQEQGYETFQIFTGFNTRWQNRELDSLDLSCFLSEAAPYPASNTLMSHCCYLINLASPDDLLWNRSIVALCQELERCENLRLPYAVLHPGAHMEAGEDAGIRRVCRALDQVHRSTAGFRSCILIENTAGQGTCLGHRFEQLGRILRGVRQPERLGVCIDTCHLFAAGYDLRTNKTYTDTMEQLHTHVERTAIKAFHLNDSKGDLASRIDRHAPIGEGKIGTEAFSFLLNDKRFAQCPAVVELPPDDASSSVSKLKLLRDRGVNRPASDGTPSMRTLALHSEASHG